MRRVSERTFLRLCAFFGDCGTQGLRWIMKRTTTLGSAQWGTARTQRLPVLLYWDSEMFRRTTRMWRTGRIEKGPKPLQDLLPSTGEVHHR